MKKSFILLAIIIVMFCTSGCRVADTILEGVLSDVEGWDLSACVDGLSTCLELIADNQDKFITGA